MTNKIKGSKKNQVLKGTGALKTLIPEVKKEVKNDNNERLTLRYHKESKQYHFCTAAEAEACNVEGWKDIKTDISPEDIQGCINAHKG